MVAMVAAVLLLQEPAPYKLSFELEKESKTAQADLKKLAGVSQVTVQGVKVTMTIKWESQVKLSEIKKIVALKPETLKVGSRVYFDFSLDNAERDKIKEALKAFKDIESTRLEGSIVAVIFKDNTSAALKDIAEAVAKHVGKKEDKPLELFAEVTWHPIKPFPKPAPG
jgi:hypothetical protein